MNISAEAMRVSSSILRNIAHDLAIDLDHDNASAIHELHKASDALWEAARLVNMPLSGASYRSANLPTDTKGGERND